MATGERPNAPDRIRTSASQGRRAMSQVRTREGPDAPDRIRTCDLWFRRPALYPTELRARDRGRTPGQTIVWSRPGHSAYSFGAKARTGRRQTVPSRRLVASAVAMLAMATAAPGPHRRPSRLSITPDPS